MIEVFVSRLGLDSTTNSYVVVLQERDGPRLLPIWIGQPEAESIVLHMHDVKRARPLTHDLVRNLVIGLGATLRRVQITRVEKSTYYAELQLQRDDLLANIDARPSDGIAIALRLGAPIFASEALLVDPGIDEGDAASQEEQGGWQPEPPDDGDDDADDSDEVIPTASDDGADAERDEAELTAEQLKRYLEALRPEDFGKFTP